MLEFQLPQPPIATPLILSCQIRDLPSGRLEQPPKPGTQADGDDRPFGIGGQHIWGIRPIPTGLQPLVTGDSLCLWG